MDKINNLDKVDNQVKIVLKENNCAIEPKIDFPKYKVLPDEVLLALKVLEKNGMKIIFSLVKK